MNKNSRINRFINELIERKLTVAFAESITCGLAAHNLSTCKGTNEVFLGSIVCYNEAVKKDLLGISASVIKKHTAESAQVTTLLVKKLRKLIKADICAAITGLASTGGSASASKPAGTVFFSILCRGKLSEHHKVFRGTPLQIREKAAMQLYEFVLRAAREATD